MKYKTVLPMYTHTHLISSMEKQRRLSKEINRVTDALRTNHPEIYRFLDENPLTIPDEKSPEVGETALRNYLESLKELLRHHVEVHEHP